MTIQQLRYLVAIAQYHSISRAAQSLFVSQSNISKAIQSLEQELGFRLLERTSRGAVFTAPGLEFLRDTYALVEHFDTFTTRHTGTTSRAACLSVSSQHYIFVLAAVASLVRQTTDARYTVSLLEHRTTGIIHDVFSRRSELGFISCTDLTCDFIFRELDKYNLTFHPFCQAVPHAYLSREHPLAREPALSLAQLEPYPYVSYDRDADSSHFAEEVFVPTRPQRAIYVTDRFSMFKIISHSAGYTLGSGYLCDTYIDRDIVTVPVSDLKNAALRIIWIEPKSRPTPPEVRDFILRCRQALDACYTGAPPSA